jgi:hypothetical protein
MPGRPGAELFQVASIFSDYNSLPRSEAKVKSREKDPKDTIRKMQQVKRAALAPSHPSGQDRSVAARASEIEAEARTELLKENSEEEKPINKDDSKSINSIPTGNTRSYYSSSSVPTIQIVV